MFSTLCAIEYWIAKTFKIFAVKYIYTFNRATFNIHKINASRASRVFVRYSLTHIESYLFKNELKVTLYRFSAAGKINFRGH